jgi:hypothetical protein
LTPIKRQKMWKVKKASIFAVGNIIKRHAL